MTPLPEGYFDAPFAHRGLHDKAAGRIENGMAAFEAAVRAGYAIELDIQVSADGEPMVFHDATLDRLTDQTGRVDARTADELVRIGLAGGADTIPTLREVLDRVAGRVPLLIEIKDQSGEMGATDGALEAGVAERLASYRGSVAVMSHSPAVIARLAETAPEIPRGLVTADYLPEGWPHLTEERLRELRRIDTEAVGAAFISHQHTDLGNPRVQELAAEGLPIMAWTIRSEAEEQAALRTAQQVTFEGYLSRAHSSA